MYIVYFRIKFLYKEMLNNFIFLTISMIFFKKHGTFNSLKQLFDGRKYTLKDKLQVKREKDFERF